MAIVNMLLTIIRALCKDRSQLALENLAPRQQLALFKRSVKRPKLGRRDRLFWVFLKRYWEGWESRLILVKPKTVVRWHRQGFKVFWKWKSRSRRRGRLSLKSLLDDAIPARKVLGSVRQITTNGIYDRHRSGRSIASKKRSRG